MELAELQGRLRAKSYGEVANELQLLDSGSLMTLLDSSVRKVGNTAAEILANRAEVELLVNGIVGKTLSTKLGRIRALNMLHSFGKKCSLSRAAYLSALCDKSADVVDCALFGLAFMQDVTVLPEMKQAVLKANSKAAADRIGLAIDAIEKNDPHIYSPYFHDKNNLWELGGGK